MTTSVTLFVTWLLYNMNSLNTFYLSECKAELETPISTVKISAIHDNSVIFCLLATVIILKGHS